ncbi:MAG: PaaI family thioesterase [Proteobacteria bacterium]|nr:PaaI family thioesterase [Pseudomonadota bacterium]
MWHEGKNPDFRQRVQENFNRQPALASIRAELTRVEQGLVELEMPFSEKLTQQHGWLHAGAISAGLDGACALAAHTLIEPDVFALTIEFKINLLSPGRGERFLFHGEITKPGSTIIVADGRAYALTDGPAKLIASMTSTLMIVRGREDMQG